MPRAAEVRSDLLGPLERRIECPRPRHRHVRVGRRRAPGVVELELIFDGEIQDAVVRGVLVGRAGQRAFGTGAVVAVDINDQRVVELALILHFLDDAADLVVGIGRVAGVDLGLPGEQLLLVGRQRFPFRQIVGPGRKVRIRGNNSQPFLIGENLLAHGIPAHVELALEFFDPLRLRLVRRVAAAGNVVDEERLVGRSGVELLDVFDRLVRHVGGEVIVGFADPRKNLPVVLEQIRRPLVGLAAHEAVEVVKTHSRRPLVERAGDGVLVGWRVVVLAEPRRGIAVVFEDPADGRVILADDRVIARESGRQLGDDAEAPGVMIASGDQRRPRRRAQRGRIELRVA